MRPPVVLSMLAGLAGTCLLGTGLALAFSSEGAKSFRLGISYFDPDRKDNKALRGRDLEAARAMSKAERFGKAVELLEEALKSGNPSKSEHERARTWLMLSYNRLASQYAEQKRFGEAEEIAGRACDLNPDDPALWCLRGRYAKEVGQRYETLQYLEKALELAGEQKEGTSDEEERKRHTQTLLSARMSLIDTLQQGAETGDASGMDRALELIADALEEHPTDEGLLIRKAVAYDRLCRWQESIEAWDELKAIRPLTEAEQSRYDKAKEHAAEGEEDTPVDESSSRFTLHFSAGCDGSEASELLAYLSRACEGLSAYFPSGAVDGDTHVYVHGGTKLAELHGNPLVQGHRAANTIDITIPHGARGETLENAVFHEYAHHLIRVRAGFNDVAWWFNEGLAQSFEPKANAIERLKAGIALYKAEKDPAVETHVALEDFGDLKVLGEVDGARAQTKAFYMVEWLTEAKGQGELLLLLDDVAGGTAFDEAFSKRFGGTPEAFFAGWQPRFRRQLKALRRVLVPKRATR